MQQHIKPHTTSATTYLTIKIYRICSNIYCMYRMRSCVHDYCMITEWRYTAMLTANDIVPLIIYGRDRFVATRNLYHFILSLQKV